MPELPMIEDIWAQFPVVEDIWPLILLGLRVAVAVLLYLFLFAAFRALYAELRPASAPQAAAQPAQAPAPSSPPPVRVAERPAGSASERPVWMEIVDGDGDLIGRRYPLREVTVIGRSPESTAVLPDRRVSGRHARLVAHNGGWWVEDLGSTNGTFINDRPVDGPVYVNRGAELRFGPVVARLAGTS